MPPYDVICLSHLRWDFVFQRPQHLMTRCARERRVFFFEEPDWSDQESAPRLAILPRGEGVTVVRPVLPVALQKDDFSEPIRILLDGMRRDHAISDFVLWYYTPMAMGFSDHLEPLATVYDCMDELSAFKNAPRTLRERERDLFERASVVFTGGQSLYEAKRERHSNVHAFPSSVEVAHFRKARGARAEPAEQAAVPHPRFGFYGVIDERFDRELLAEIARLRPDWQFVMIGPVVKIDPAELPSAPNIHYLGQKRYDDLPSFLSGWDAALLLFARNESTRYISPTKTPEYLAAGRPVVSTSIRDVVHPYGDLGLVLVADEPRAFVQAIEAALDGDGEARQARADAFLARSSWDHTWKSMAELIDEAVRRKAGRSASMEGVTYV
jgi:UDP-galactopyranose mutase